MSRIIPQPENAATLLAKVKASKLEDDWWCDVIEKLPDYWLGYFTATIEQAGESMALTSEEFREWMIEWIVNCFELPPE